MKRWPVFFIGIYSPQIRFSACTAHAKEFYASVLLSCFGCDSGIHKWFFIIQLLLPGRVLNTLAFPEMAPVDLNLSM